MQKLHADAQRFAALNSPVLILGETGTGKTLLARFMHALSRRKNGQLIEINCASIPETLLESELFGYSKGAFTGAIADKPGKFQEAHGGTLFLDEIGDMSLALQAKLLHVLEGKKITRLGSNSPEECDVRILAATHRDLKTMIAAGQFRSDLYYRLNDFILRLPPLRDHLEDIDQLAPHLLQSFCAENNLPDIQLSPNSLEVFKEHNWPGNIRELRSVLHRCAGLCTSALIDASAVREAIQST